MHPVCVLPGGSFVGTMSMLSGPVDNIGSSLKQSLGRLRPPYPYLLCRARGDDDPRQGDHVDISGLSAAEDTWWPGIQASGARHTGTSVCWGGLAVSPRRPRARQGGASDHVN